MSTNELLQRTLHKDITIEEFVTYKKTVTLGQSDVVFCEEYIIKLNPRYKDWYDKSGIDILKLKAHYVASLLNTNGFNLVDSSRKRELALPRLVYRFKENPINTTMLKSNEYPLYSEYQWSIPSIRKDIESLPDNDF